MEEILLESTDQQPEKRPTFLTVLCILTFIGSGLALLGAIPSMFISDYSESYYVLMDNELYDGGPVPSLEEFNYWTRVSNVSSLITGLAGLAGALIIWQLKKIGFFIYIGSWSISMGFVVFTNQYLIEPFMGKVGVAIIGFNALIMIAFLVMYGVNLKYM